MANQLKVEVVGDTRSYSNALNASARATESFGRSATSHFASLAKGAAFAAGAAGIGAIAVTLKAGISEWQQTAKVAAQTQAVIESTGGAANVTAGHISDLATSLMNLSGVDDETIASGENMLLTFTNIQNQIGKGNDIFDQTTKAVLDMTTAMSHGNVTQENMSKMAILVGKAMNDPIKGMTALRRVGVAFTQSQVDTIKKLVETGHTMEAQKMILRELNKEFGGSAKAMGDTMPGQIMKLKEAFNNLAGGIVGSLAPAFATALEGINNFITQVGQAHGFVGKIKVAATLVWEGLENAVGVLREKINHLLFGGVAFGAGGVGPQGIKIDEGMVQKFADAFEAVDWTAVGDSIINGVVNAIKKAGELAKALADTVMESVRNVNWEAVGRIMGPGLAAALAAAFKTLTDPAFWVRNWDLALAIMLVAFGGGIAKVAGKLLAPMAKLGGDLVLAVAGAIERLSPRLASAFLVGIEVIGRIASAAGARIAQLLGAGLGALEGVVRAIFGRLAGLVILTVKILGIEAAIQAISGFVADVGRFFSGIGRSISGAFQTAWQDIERGSLRAALLVVEPFSHLPWGLGKKAQEAKAAMEAELNKIDASRAAQKIIDTIGDHTAGMRAAGAALAEALASGITDGLASKVLAVGQSIGNFIATVGSYAHAHTGSTTEEYAAKVLGEPIGMGVVMGVQRTGPSTQRQIAAYVSRWIAYAGQAAVRGSFALSSSFQVLGTKLSAALNKAFTAVGQGGGLGAGIAKSLGPVGAMIVAAAKKWGIDARAALAVAMTEGGLKAGGKAGDSGTSFGPFQLHIGGELPKAFEASSAAAQKFAWSAEGVNLALRRMAEEGAKGLTGLAALKQIIGGPGWGFERPANAAAELAKAVEFYKRFPGLAAAALKAGAPILSAAGRQAITTGFATIIGMFTGSGPGMKVGLAAAREIGVGVASGKPGVVNATIKTITDAAKAAGAAAQQAFGGLAQRALDAFDAKVAAWKNPITAKMNAAADKAAIAGAGTDVGSAVSAITGGSAVDAQKQGEALGKIFAESLAGAISTVMGSVVTGNLQKDIANLNTAANAAVENMTAQINAAAAPALAQVNSQVAAAQAALDAATATGDQEAITKAQQDLTDAVGRRTTLETAVQAAITTATGQLATLTDTRMATIAAHDKAGLENQLTQLGTYLGKHPEEWNKMGVAVEKIVAGFNGRLEKAGEAWVIAFAKGVRNSISEGEAAMRELARALAAILPSVSSPLKPAKKGPLAFHPYKMGKAWSEAMTSGLRAGRIGNFVGNLGSGVRLSTPGGTLASSSGGDTYNITVQSPLGINPPEIAAAIRREILRTEKRNVTAFAR